MGANDEGPMATVFVSHSAQDREVVESRIIAPLNGRGVRTWYSRDDIQTAEEWEASIRRALGDCDWFLVALSPAAVKSRWVKSEVSWALQRRPDRVIPVLIVPCDATDCHLQLGLIQHLDFVSGQEEALRRLVDRLAEAPGGRGTEGSGRLGEDAAIERLRAIRDSADPLGAVEAFAGLAHDDPAVRTRAQQALHAIGFGRAMATLEGLVRGSEAGAVVGALAGLEKLASTRDLADALGRLVDAARGGLRLRLIDLAERKRLSLEMETLAELFRQHRPSYEIVRVLGQGLFVAAYLSRHRASDLETVVRVLRPELALEPRVRTAFLDSTRRAMRYVHQNLAMTRDVGHFEKEGVYFVLRDFIPGVTLRQLLQQGKAFTVHQIVRIAASVIEALQPIHARGEAHGGVKPSNIFLAEDDRVVLGDPEPAVSILGTGLDRLGYDYRYAAPETLAPRHELEPPSDMYALGCVLYELACGHPPYESANPFELVSLHLGGPPPSLAACRLPEPGPDVVRGLLARRIEGRLRDGARVLAMLRRCAEAAPAAEAGRAAVFDRDAREVMDAETSVLMLKDPGDVYGTMIGPAPAAASASARPGGPVASTAGAAPGAAAPQAPMGAPSLVPGQLFGKYRIESVVGRGGLGTVYRATHLVLDRTVALKVLSATSLNEESRARFLREMRTHGSMVHPNVVAVHDAEEVEGAFTIAMEFLEGQDLSHLVRRRGPLGVAAAAAIVEQAASGLAYLHGRAVVHRDIKPSNLMLTRVGVVKIMDLGLARLVGAGIDAEVTQAGMIVGTPAYMPPEQAAGGSVGPASDLYSLGATLFFLLAGKPPFEGTPLEVIVGHVSGKPPGLAGLRTDVPAELEALLQRLLAKKSADRPQRADELAAALRPYALGAGLEGLL